MKPPRILVVDDNEANRALVQGTLEDEGYAVSLATSGAEALRSFEAEAPDCVLLDVRMPGMDGFTVCERIRALPRGSDTPVLFLTAHRDVDTFDHALRSGGDDFLAKPIRPAELVVRVQTALQLRRLRGEVRQHYELLTRQRNDLLRLQLQKERLMAFVVHDLKNPVNSMDLQAQLLLRDRSLSAEAQEAAGQIRNEARQLTRMILNLLDLAKADEGLLSPRRAAVDLRALVAEVLRQLEVSAGNHRVSLQLALEADEVHADRELLRRTLSNLVENAIRYAPTGSQVRVTARRVQEGLELRVTDGGSGIPAEMREKIFDPFVQVDHEERNGERSGRGLGLAFCKLSIEAQGGRIWVEDARPGAAFCVRLPDAG